MENVDDEFTKGGDDQHESSLTEYIYSIWQKPTSHTQMKARFRVTSTVLLLIFILLLIYMIYNSNLVIIATLSVLLLLGLVYFVQQSFLMDNFLTKQT